MKPLLALSTLAWVIVTSAADDVVASNIVPPVETNAPVSSMDWLGEASLDESVILAVVQDSAGQFDLLAADIIYLEDLGVTPPLIAALRLRNAPSTSQPSLRTESPRGREQRPSPGREMRQAPSAPARPAQPSTAPRARGQETTNHR